MRDPEKVFKIERLDDTLVVMPQGPTLEFAYNEVHLESNALVQIADEPGLTNLVVDLRDVDYIDSVIISSVLRLLTRTKQNGGKSVFCHASSAMKEILQCIRLGKLWPHFDTREEALQSLAN